MTYREAYALIASKVPTEDIKVQQRLDRGLDILSNYGYGITHITDDQYLITRASTSLLEDNTVVYSVTSKHCSCPDAETARAGLCKHRFAVLLLCEMSKADKQERKVS